MNRGEDSDSIPNDLVLEILSRLPAKSTGRFRCVSKLWGSMLHKPYFTKLFLTRSSARPRLLIELHQYGQRFFFSSPHPDQTLYEKSSIVVTADFHMKFGSDPCYQSCRYASGLLYLTSTQIPGKDEDIKRVICNPITRQFAFLPNLGLTDKTYHEMLGFDLTSKQWKVLSINNNKLNDEKVHYILTLGTEKLRWRKIQCPFSHEVVRGEGISISGVLYYLATDYVNRIDVISCFDVRSEKFTFLNLNPYCPYQGSTTLINYKGKLGVINLMSDNDGVFPIQLCMCVLEDLEKQEWSTYVYTLMPENKVVKTKYKVSVVGMTSTGEIVLAKTFASKPFYVFYFNVERNTLLSVEIQGYGEDHKWFDNYRVYAFVDHVEDLQFNIMKKPSISPPEQKRKTTRTSTSSRKDHQGRTVAHPQ